MNKINQMNQIDRAYAAHVDSKLTCPVYGAHDLSGSSPRVFQPRAEIVARTVALGSTIGGTFDLWVEPG